jgi:type I restriction enzyme S subunit
MVAVRPDPKLVDPLYLLAALRSEIVQGQISKMHVGTLIPHFKKGDFENLHIPLPDRKAQEGIGKLYLLLSKKIAVNERIAATAVGLADLHFAEAVRGIAEEKAFAEVAEIYGGGTPKTSVAEYWDGPVAWTTPTDITALSAPYLLSTAKTITDDGLASCASRLYPAGSIFMTSRATIGRFAINQIPAAVNQGFIVVVARNEIMRWWLFHEMRDRVGEMIALANGSTFLELSRKNFKAMNVRLPDDGVAERFAETVRPIHLRAAQAVQESQTLTELRDTLLPKLMSGEIRVKDAERRVGEVV